MFLTTFLVGQWTHTPIPTASFSGQTVIITGSNTGIGLSAARYFALLGAAHIILGVRNTTAGEAAANAIRNAPNTSSMPHLPDAVTCKVSVWELDLADYASVIAFSERCDRELERVDVLVENAGVLANSFEMAEPWEGMRMERCVAVNVVGTMLLAVLMLPVLRKGRTGGKGEAPRLCIVSSEVHELTELPQRKEEKILDACNDEGRNEMGDRYNVTKLLQVFLARALASRLPQNNSSSPTITLNYLTPTLCHSDLGRDFGSLYAAFLWIFAKPTEEGGRAIVDAAAKGKGSHGEFLWCGRVRGPSQFVLSEEGKQTQERVFQEVMEVLEKVVPGISNNI
ncbi:MAG: hypothetical protein OHK93_006856 [Ramalina farinacea]|uniref:NAD(P)-binding protein n=1 Tax=Ramalina farinacea TaxID=258253 RepID=A0AA43QMA1_9LECA|nr:hypothetical protein [Ramalina farinacea]